MFDSFNTTTTNYSGANYKLCEECKYDINGAAQIEPWFKLEHIALARAWDEAHITCFFKEKQYVDQLMKNRKKLTSETSQTQYF